MTNHKYTNQDPAAERYALWKVFLALMVFLAWSEPIWNRSSYLWNFDAVFHKQWYQAFYQTVLQYGEWPGLNPWISAGEPINGHANYGIFSIRSALVLLLTPQVGIGVSILVYWVIGFLGAYKLSSIWWGNKYYKLLFSILVVLNSSFVAHLTLSHYPQQTVILAPWILYYFFQRERDKWSGVKAGLIYSLGVNESFAYGMMYIAAIGVLLILYELIFKGGGNPNFRKRILLWVISFTLVVLVLTFYRFASVLYVISGWDRELEFLYSYDFQTIFNSLFNPLMYKGQQYWHGTGYQYCGNYTEIGFYIGFIYAYYIYQSFRHDRIGIWHILPIVLLFSIFNNSSYLSLTYWLSYLPGFSSHLCDNRISMLANILLAILAVKGIRYTFEKSKGKSTPLILVALFLSEQLLVTYYISHKTRDSLNPSSEQSKVIGDLIMQKAHTKNEGLVILRDVPDGYQDIKGGFPLSFLTENNISIRKRSSASNFPVNSDNIFTKGSDFAHVFFQLGKAVYPDHWSPNLISFSGLERGEKVEIRYTPSKAWIVNGERVFGDNRIVENVGLFFAYPDSKGNLSLKYDMEIMKGKYVYLFATIFLLLLNVAYIKRYSNKYY